MTGETPDAALVVTGDRRLQGFASWNRGIVVVQEIFGVNHQVRAVTDWLASVGDAALAPALFDSAEGGVELAYGQAGMARGMALLQAIPEAQLIQSVAAAIENMAAFGPVGIVGFCLGDARLCGAQPACRGPLSAIAGAGS